MRTERVLVRCHGGLVSSSSLRSSGTGAGGLGVLGVLGLCGGNLRLSSSNLISVSRGDALGGGGGSGGCLCESSLRSRTGLCASSLGCGGGDCGGGASELATEGSEGRVAFVVRSDALGVRQANLAPDPLRSLLNCCLDESPFCSGVQLGLEIIFLSTLENVGPVADSGAGLDGTDGVHVLLEEGRDEVLAIGVSVGDGCSEKNEKSNLHHDFWSFDRLSRMDVPC